MDCFVKWIVSVAEALIKLPLIVMDMANRDEPLRVKQAWNYPNICTHARTHPLKRIRT